MCGKAQIVTKIKLWEKKKIQTKLTLNFEEEKKLKYFIPKIMTTDCDKTHFGTQLKLRQ